VWETIDPDGRNVLLTDDGWTHILDGHPYIDVGPEAIVKVVARPDERLLGPKRGEEWFYRRGMGPSAWIRVVVHYWHGRGVIVTAFPRRSIP
jgi:hypothetical protein